jgi:hypothetical protein
MVTKENTMNTHPSKTILFICICLSIILSACGANAPVVTPTVTITNTPVPPTFTPTITLTPTKTPTPTATPNLAATQQYEDFLAMVQKIYDAGQISTLEGTYSKLDDYSDELAMEYGYQWTSTGVSAKSFIVRADFDWSVANQKNYSGCGYMFRQEPNDPSLYYLIALDGLNGILLTYTEYTGDASGINYYNYPAPLIKKMRKPDMGSNPYHAQFTLIVTDTTAYTYVNENFFTEHTLPANDLTQSGSLYSLILTGSDTDYGTRCKITNAELWIIEP